MVLSTTGSKAEAKKLAEKLLSEKLAACVQITNITSIYEWKNKINCDDEQLLLIKTKDSLYKKVEQFISENHSYEVPEIIKIPVKNGLTSYLNWIDEICD